jgi:uncharacterized protein YndB with AHSA1/START domain
MRTSESVSVPAPPAAVFEHVARLEAYPAWLGLVHVVEPDESFDSAPAWHVELRARIGPFARSKRLRMIRTEHEVDRLAVFERAETDGRQHARWLLRAELEPVGDDGTVLTMHLAYDGALWTGGLLERALDDEIRRGRAELVRLVTGEPTR